MVEKLIRRTWMQRHSTKFLVFFFLFLFYREVFSTELEVLQQRVQRQQKICEGSWCLVSWDGGLCSAEVINIDKGIATVKIFDTSRPVSQWPIIDVYIGDLYKHTFEKSSTLDSLIKSLKEKNILRTPFIEEGFRAVDRAWFCSEHPYFDVAIDIGCGMCISTPHIHTFSLELLKDCLPKAKRILDVGTGSGYMAAIFSYLAPQSEVIGIDYYKSLVECAKTNCQKALPKEVFRRITFVVGDGENGVKEEEKFDLIYVGFMCNEIPKALIKQMNPNGTLLVPIKKRVSSYDNRLFWGSLLIVTKKECEALDIQEVFECSFIPSQTGFKSTK